MIPSNRHDQVQTYQVEIQSLMRKQVPADPPMQLLLGDAINHLLCDSGVPAGESDMAAYLTLGATLES